MVHFLLNMVSIPMLAESLSSNCHHNPFYMQPQGFIPARPWIMGVKISYSTSIAANRAFAMGQQELLNSEPTIACQYLRIAGDKNPGFLWAQRRGDIACHRR